VDAVDTGVASAGGLQSNGALGAPPAELERVELPDEACRRNLLLRRSRMDQVRSEYAAYLLGLADALGVADRLVDADVREGVLLVRPASPSSTPGRPPLGAE
jgi:hypothetical protein